MVGEFFADILFIYIEKEITENFNFDQIINEFKNMKKQMTIIMVILNYAFIIFISGTIIKI